MWDRIEVGDCWQWIGRLSYDGYGRYGKRGQMAHRLVWEALVGPIPEGFQVDHLCRNRACVNPDHLEPVLPAVNVQRTPKGMKGRHGNNLRGTESPNGRKTHCKHGHEFTPENTRQTDRQRLCRECARIGDRLRDANRTRNRYRLEHPV